MLLVLNHITIMELNQVIEIMTKSEDTLMKFINLHVERLESKIDKIMEENILLKSRVTSVEVENVSLKSEMAKMNEAMNFNSLVFDEKIAEMKEMRKNMKVNVCKYGDNEEAARTVKELEAKVLNLEDRIRRNNLRFNGLKEDLDET